MMRIPWFLLFGAVAWAGCSKSEPPTPEDVVLGMFEASRTGKVDEYLDYFAADMRDVLDKTLEDMGREEFRRYLLSTNEPIVGIAVSDREPVDVDQMRLRVELVYRNKNEVQYFTLQEAASGWRIRHMTKSRRIKTLIPYGQKVFDLPEESVAQGDSATAP